jgi:hypothetical protein
LLEETKVATGENASEREIGSIFYQNTNTLPARASPTILKQFKEVKVCKFAAILFQQRL